MKKFTFLLTILFSMNTFQAGAQILDIPEVIQEQDQWCWAGCTKSILDFYKHPVTQCEIADYARTVITWRNFGSSNCCADPGQGCNYWNYNYSAKGSMQDILMHFDSIQNNGLSSAIALDKISTELQAERPFIIRWGWKSGGGHFIVGHGVSDSMVYYMNPWFGEGLHIANYDWMKNDVQHTWTHTNVLITSPPPKLSTRQQLEESNSIFPNPGNGVFTIKTDHLFSDKAVLQIVNPIGAIILSKALTGTNTEIDLSMQAKGVYWIRIEDGETCIIKKIVKL